MPIPYPRRTPKPLVLFPFSWGPARSRLQTSMLGLGHVAASVLLILQDCVANRPMRSFCFSEVRWRLRRIEWINAVESRETAQCTRHHGVAVRRWKASAAACRRRHGELAWRGPHLFLRWVCSLLALWAKNVVGLNGLGARGGSWK